MHVHHHHFCILCGDSAADEDFESGDVCGGGCNFSGVIQSVATYCKSEPFLFFFVRLIITYYFFIRDLMVLGNICQFNKDTSVRALYVPDSLEEASQLVSKTSFPKRP
jgi:hypothetical protein